MPTPAIPSAIPSSGPLVAGPFPADAARPGVPAAIPPTIALDYRPPPTLPSAQQPQPPPPLQPPPLQPPPLQPPPPSAAAACPRCSTPVQPGFAFCQQCGAPLQGLDSGAAGRGARPPSAASPVVRPPTAAGQPPVDPQASTLATDAQRAGIAVPAPSRESAPAPRAPAGAVWGTAILVNRDGSDGHRYALGGDSVTVGRSGCDIAFDDDRFLGRQHARIERGADGVVRIVPLDGQNGVFRKADAPIELADGAIVLVGREVLRYERVDPEEIKVQPVIRHGVALFGSPPREPWGRLLHLIPNGGYRDVRHLHTEEIVLGREEGDIVFRDDAFMSRRHAAVTWDGRRAQLTDLGSSNGTFLRVTGPTPLKSGDHVRMGDQLLRIELPR